MSHSMQEGQRDCLLFIHLRGFELSADVKKFFDSTDMTKQAFEASCRSSLEVC